MDLNHILRIALARNVACGDSSGVDLVWFKLSLDLISSNRDKGIYARCT
jgi:hypothetical protein